MSQKSCCPSSSASWRLQTLLFADYVGYAYPVWVLLIAMPLLDVAYNRGRALRALGHALGEIAQP